jgi:hypothetical protein
LEEDADRNELEMLNRRKESALIAMGPREYDTPYAITIVAI